MRIIQILILLSNLSLIFSAEGQDKIQLGVEGSFNGSLGSLVTSEKETQFLKPKFGGGYSYGLVIKFPIHNRTNIISGVIWNTITSGYKVKVPDVIEVSSSIDASYWSLLISLQQNYFVFRTFPVFTSAGLILNRGNYKGQHASSFSYTNGFLVNSVGTNIIKGFIDPILTIEEGTVIKINHVGEIDFAIGYNRNFGNSTIYSVDYTVNGNPYHSTMTSSNSYISGRIFIFPSLRKRVKHSASF